MRVKPLAISTLQPRYRYEFPEIVLTDNFTVLVGNSSEDIECAFGCQRHFTLLAVFVYVFLPLSGHHQCFALMPSAVYRLVSATSAGFCFSLTFLLFLESADFLKIWMTRMGYKLQHFELGLRFHTRSSPYKYCISLRVVFSYRLEFS